MTGRDDNNEWVVGKLLGEVVEEVEAGLVEPMAIFDEEDYRVVVTEGVEVLFEGEADMVIAVGGGELVEGIVWFFVAEENSEDILEVLEVLV